MVVPSGDSELLVDPMQLLALVTGRVGTVCNCAGQTPRTDRSIYTDGQTPRTSTTLQLWNQLGWLRISSLLSPFCIPPRPILEPVSTAPAEGLG